MSIRDIASPIAIEATMKEYARIGRNRFLEKYDFGKSRDYMLRDPRRASSYMSPHSCSQRLRILVGRRRPND